MSWNEPGSDKKDPWSGRNDQDGPPDLDEAIRKLQDKLSRLFGDNQGGGLPSGDSGDNRPIFLFGALVLAATAAIWLGSGFYIVDEGNHGVETRFGKFIGITQAGLHWHIPFPVEQADIVNVKQQRFIEVGYRSAGSDQMTGSVPKEALMLTKDENYVDVRLAVQYQVKSARDFLFNVASPSSTLKQVTESAERGVIGGNTMDFVLTEGRSEIVTQIKKEIQEVMDSYRSGIQITSVNLQDAQPPEQVQNAFADAIKAREDRQRLINEAEAYANDLVPKARGAAARKLQEAEGYKEQVMAQADGDANRFTQMLTQYGKASDVTRNRLFLDTMETVLSETNTILVDTQSNNVMYLPLEKLTIPKAVGANINNSGATTLSGNASVNETEAAQVAVPSMVEERVVDRSNSRGREARGR